MDNQYAARAVPFCKAYDVGKLRLGNQALGFCADELLFELDNLGTLRLLVLEFGNFVRNLGSYQ